jgi:hypothetical protein
MRVAAVRLGSVDMRAVLFVLRRVPRIEPNPANAKHPAIEDRRRPLIRDPLHPDFIVFLPSAVSLVRVRRHDRLKVLPVG